MVLRMIYDNATVWLGIPLGPERVKSDTSIIESIIIEQRNV